MRGAKRAGGAGSRRRPGASGLARGRALVVALAAAAAIPTAFGCAAAQTGPRADVSAEARPGSGADVQAPDDPRIRLTVNDGWRYADGPLPGAEAPSYEDSAWQAVDLPHTWNRGASLDEGAAYRRGVGWYRKVLEVPSSLGGKRLFLHFEGANQVAEVFVDGHRLGEHIGGYTAFAFDVTEHVRPGEPSVVAVRVDNSHHDDIPPLNADFTFYGGIYRDVWLIATEPVHVTLLDHASPGLYIDTPEVSEERATVRIRGTLVNATDRARTVEVVSRVLDPAGAPVTTIRSDVEIPAGGEAPFTKLSGEIAGPLLWSPAEPNLYRVVTEVREGGRVTDRVRNPLGFRWFEITPDRGFFLNGRPQPLIGTNRHQDRAGYGNALPNALHRQDVEIVKATGFDFLRLAHYPQDPTVLEAMDRLGLVGWEEIPVVNIITLSEAFGDNSERMLIEMIRQHYNHPSIVFWGYMNEVMLREPRPLPEGYYDRVVELGRRLERVVEREDPTRATVTAISLHEIDNETGFQDIPDVLGFNLYFGWYYRELDGIGAYLDTLHARHPDRPLMISEYGAGSDERIHTLEPEAFDFSTEYQQRFHETQLPLFLERDYLVGTAVWNQFDFGSDHRHDSKPNINQKGLLYYDRTPKDLWHWYRAMLLDEPVLHIATRDWPLRAGSRPGDAAFPIVVYSNLDEVELLRVGEPKDAGERLREEESLGSRTVRTGRAEWTVTLRPGQNRLVARGAGPAGEVRDETVVVYEDRTPLLTGERAAAGPGAGSGEPALAADLTGAAIAVNAGSHYQYVDRTGVVWEADRAYEPGGWGHVGGEPRLNHRRIAGSIEEGLFQATQEGVEVYRFDVPDGEYDVRLMLAETLHDQPGERVFSVRVNDVPVFDALDLAAGPGPHTALQRTVRVTTEDGQGIVVSFQASAGETTVSGIEVRRR